MAGDRRCPKWRNSGFFWAEPLGEEYTMCRYPDIVLFRGTSDYVGSDLIILPLAPTRPSCAKVRFAPWLASRPTCGQHGPVFQIERADA